MIDNWNALDRIEHAERETPFCICGQPMVPAARNDGIWLECCSLPQIDRGLVRRFVSTLITTGHIRRLIVEPFADAA
jgi:hypothetical protein